MGATSPASVRPPVDKSTLVLPETFLSCYEIVNADELRWSVRLYRVRRVDGDGQSHEERGEIKQAVWTLRKKYQGLCRGYGFVIDVAQEIVAVPAEWNLPSGEVADGFLVTFDRSFETDPSEQVHRAIIAGILREAIKRHFKDNQSDSFGPHWQDYDRFCQMPEGHGDRDFQFCRAVPGTQFRGHHT